MVEKLAYRSLIRRKREGKLFRGKRCDCFDKGLLIVLPAVFVERDEWRCLFRHVNLFLLFDFAIRVFVSRLFSRYRVPLLSQGVKRGKEIRVRRGVQTHCTMRI